MGIIYGKIMLVDRELKRNTGGKTELAKRCATGEERTEALRKYLGIRSMGEEREDVRGTIVELLSH